MEKYYCKYCKYLTDNLHNINRHILSKKHKVNSNGNDILVAKLKIHICISCNKEFIDRKAKWRHEKQCNAQECNTQECNTVTSSNIIHKTISEIDSNVTNTSKNNDIILMQQSQLKQYESMLSDYKTVIESLASSNKSTAEASSKTAEAATKSMSILKYATTHMADAPPMTEINNEEAISILGYKGEDSTLSKEQQEHINEIYVQSVVAHYTNKNIVNFLSDMIVAYFRKPGVDYKKLSSIWAVDVARLSFIIMSTINKDGEKEWRSDKTGKLFKSMVIKPMLKALDVILQQYIKYKENWHIKHPATTVEEMGKLMLIRQGCVELSKDIRYQQFERQLIKCVAPSFQFDQFMKKK